MLTAMLAVSNMKGGDHDIWAVNTGYEYLEEQKLEASDARRRERPGDAGVHDGGDAGRTAGGVPTAAAGGER